MKILVDTNVLIDVAICRMPFFPLSEKVLYLCQKEIVEGVIAAHSIVDMAYILRKNLTLSEFKELILSLSEFLHVETIDFEKILRAIEDKGFKDFEDCLQMQCAINFNADYIVTRNVDDFKSSDIPAITPADFCKLFENVEE